MQLCASVSDAALGECECDAGLHVRTPWPAAACHSGSSRLCPCLILSLRRKLFSIPKRLFYFRNVIITMEI